MIYWMYFLPLWLSGLITIVVFCAFGVTGLALTRRWAPSLHHATVSYNDIVGYFFGAITCSLWHHARPAHARGNMSRMLQISNDLAAFEPASEEQKILHPEIYNRFNELAERRRSRLLWVTAGLSGALWVLVYIGAAINIAVT